ncbi:MAG TPA: serine/threonine-protein kinase [Candidatus Sulfomarinibacteraceae bacterium]|nr:serine/threonine-protein kinase [Candidatus Sulfomarinibacteraceae bacterium]
MQQNDDEDMGRPQGPPGDDEGTVSVGGTELPGATISASGSGSGERNAGPQQVTVAGYRIIRELGRGGMGVVWEAEQERPRRRVALKVMRRDHQVDELHARMFQREAETLARLKHPNIAAIYASGHTDEGHDYFAMELVSGETLDRWLAGRPKVVDAAELKLRLRLFGTICDAVHYAHQRGVIHRDLKPSNIVVTDEAVSSSGSPHSSAGPTVKILDFGLARITDADIAATTVSEIGMIKGTLQYMSPEQARGDVESIDVRSDVYALGIILYELLAGKRPYDVSRSALAEAVRVICEEPPRSLRQSWRGAGRLDPDLETIAGKAMEKDVDRRYGSAAALGEDVERHLQSQPILARPPSAAYQMRKFAARNRALVGGAAATLIALVAGVAVSTTFGLREAEQRREAEKARTDLEAVVEFQSRMLAEVDAEQMGRAMLADLRERVVEAARDVGAADGAVERAGAAFDELTRRVNTTDAALEVIDTQILGRAAATIDAEFEDRPEIGIELRSTIVGTYGELGLLAQAVAQAETAYEASGRVFGAEDGRTLEAGRKLAEERMFLGELDEAEDLAASIYETELRVLGETDEKTLRSRRLLAMLRERRGLTEEAEQAYLETLAAQRELLGDEDDDTMATMSSLAALYRNLGRGAEAEKLVRELIGVSSRKHGAEDPKTLVYRHNLAWVFNGMGRYEEASELNRDLLEVKTRVLGADHPGTLRTMSNLAESYYFLGRLEEARPLAVKNMEAQRRTVGPDHPDALDATNFVGVITKRMGRFDEAVPFYLEALEGRRRVFGPDHPDTLRTMYGLANLYEEMGRNADAETLYLETIAGQKRTFGVEHRQPLRSQMSLSGFYAKLGRDDEAGRLYTDTAAAQLRAMGDADPEAISGQTSAAVFFIQHDRLDEAEPYAVTGLELAVKALGDDNPITLDARSALGYLRQRQQRWQESEAIYREVLATQVETVGREHTETANTLQNLACLYRDSGSYDESRKLFEEVVAIQEKAWGPNHAWSVDNLEDYLKLAQAMGDTRLASALEARISAIKGG